jgi:hypothetical protein
MARKAKVLPLDDGCWRPLVAEHRRLAELNDDCFLAALDLTKALADDKLPCMWRRRCDGEPWRVPAAFWSDYALSCGPEGDAEVISRRHRGAAPLPAGFVVIQSAGLIARRQAESARASPIEIPAGGVVFFIRGPDADKLWPPCAECEEAEPKIDERRKPGKKITGKWKLVAANELHRIVIIEKSLPPTAAELAEYCDGKLGYMPDLSDMQKLIRELI